MNNVPEHFGLQPTFLNYFSNVHVTGYLKYNQEAKLRSRRDQCAGALHELHTAAWCDGRFTIFHTQLSRSTGPDTDHSENGSPLPWREEGKRHFKDHPILYSMFRSQLMTGERRVRSYSGRHSVLLRRKRLFPAAWAPQPCAARTTRLHLWLWHCRFTAPRRAMASCSS